MSSENTPILLGISGASGSGKTLLAEQLARELQSCSMTMVSEDNYYRDQSHLGPDCREKTNYDHPAALEHSLLHAHLKSLKSGLSIKQPVYDFERHTRADMAREISGAGTRLILVEGIMLFYSEKLREVFDLKVFIDAPMEVCLQRRLQRDMKHRGRTEASIRAQFNDTVLPGYLEFVEPTRQHADLVVSNVGAIDAALAQISEVLKQRLLFP